MTNSRDQINNDHFLGFEGFPLPLVEATAKRIVLLRKGLKRERPEQTQLPAFSPKMPKIPRLDNYDVEAHSEEYWSNWPFYPMPSRVKSWIDPKKLIKRARDSKFPKLDWVKKVARDLTHGVDLGFRGAGRLEGEGKNAKTLVRAGFRAYDAVASWVDQGLVSGPLTRDQLPPCIRVSPASSQDKPNGRSRVCVNMSFPHLTSPDIWSTTVPCSPNASVDKTLYSVRSSTSADVVKALHREGRSGFISKVDW